MDLFNIFVKDTNFNPKIQKEIIKIEYILHGINIKRKMIPIKGISYIDKYNDKKYNN